MEKKTKNTQDDDVLNATAEQSTSQKKEERIIVVDEPQAEGERSLPSQATLLRNVGVLIKEIDKKLNPGGSQSDTYNAALKSIKGLTTRDYTNVVEQEKQELLAEARVNDTEKDNITVKPPLHFGTEDFTDSEERHLRQWRQGIPRPGPALHRVGPCKNDRLPSQEWWEIFRISMARTTAAPGELGLQEGHAVLQQSGDEGPGLFSLPSGRSPVGDITSPSKGNATERGSRHERRLPYYSRKDSRLEQDNRTQSLRIPVLCTPRIRQVSQGVLWTKRRRHDQNSLQPKKHQELPDVHRRK